MPSPLVECVPNFSEGRNAATIEALRLPLTSVPGVRLLDVQSDAAHNRSVFTFVAPPDPSVEAALAAMRVATERIDLSHHTGEHPRMGATDVVPFVPVRDATMDDCVALARRLAERAAAELQVPIYLYAKAATRPERERLPDIRKGEFEGLRERSEEHTSELQSPCNLVCRLLLEKKKKDAQPACLISAHPAHLSAINQSA